MYHFEHIISYYMHMYLHKNKCKLYMKKLEDYWRLVN